MARYHSPVTLSGSIGGATFSDNNGKPTARAKGGMTTRKWRQSPHLEHARDHSAAFGAASKLAARIRAQLDNDFRRLFGAHTHNRITKAILDAAPRSGRCRVPAFPAVISTAALRQLDLGHLPKEGSKPMASTQHHPFTEKVTIHNLRQLRDSITLRKGELLDYRIITAQVHVPSASADPDNKGRFQPDESIPTYPLAVHKGEWTAACLLPETVEVPAPHADNTVLIIGVEWRTLTGHRLKYHPRHNVIRIAAAHIGNTPEDLKWMNEKPKKRKPRPKGGKRRATAHPVTLTPKEAKAIRQRHAEAQLSLKPPLIPA